jgi:hypothetical protein
MTREGKASLKTAVKMMNEIAYAVGIKKTERCNTTYDFLKVIDDYIGFADGEGLKVSIAFSSPTQIVTLCDNEQFFTTKLMGDENKTNKFPQWVVDRFSIPAFAYDPEHIYLDPHKDILTISIYYPSGIQIKVAVCILEYNEKGKIQSASKMPMRQDLTQFVKDMIVFPQ